MIFSDYQDLLDGLSPEIRRSIDELYGVFAKAGYECYLVGGLVRDLLMGRSGGDVDIATNARPERVQKLFRRTIPTGIKHGTITVMIDDLPFEVTTYRADGDYSDGRRPDSVAYSERLIDDLARRDFTINALAFEPGRRELVDEFDGLGDLKDKRIRTIGDPRQRFFEDGLRPVRACRFASTLEFDPVEETYAALKESEVQKRTALVAVERFADELWKGMKSARPERMIRLLEATELMYLFAFADSVPAASRRADASLDQLGDLGPCAPAFKMAWWWRAAGIDPDDFEKLTKALKFSGRQVRDIRRYHHYIRFQIDGDRDGARDPVEASLVDARRFLGVVKGDYREEAADFLRASPDLPEQAFARSALLEILARDPLVLGDLCVGGKDLQKFGFQGKEIGRVLGRLLDAVHGDPALNERESLYALIEKLKAESGANPNDAI